MGEFNMHRIKRRAHREAWGDPTNPFARGPSRANSYPEGGVFSRNDEESNVGLSPITDDRDLRRLSTEPAGHSRPLNDDTISPSTMTRASTGWDEKLNGENIEGRGANGNGHAQSSEETAVERTVTSETGGLKKRKFLGIFPRKDKSGENDLETTPTGLSSKSKKSKKPHKPFTFKNQIKNTLFNSWINILLLAAPVGIALHFTTITPIAVFVVNFIAIIPLAALLSYATEEIALRVGETLGGLLNASFGNAVELIVSIIALTKNEIVIVKTSLIGSILSNLLLVMGMCFFFGGLRREEQFFNVTVATTAASLLALAIASVIIPSAFTQFAFDNSENTETEAQKQGRTSAISRGTAIILLFVYGCYLFFQLKTHSAMYMQESKKVAIRPSKRKLPDGNIAKGLATIGGVGAGPGRTKQPGVDRPPNDELLQADAYDLQAAADDDEDDEPNLHLWVAIALLAGSTVIIALCAEFMVDSISEVTKGDKVSTEFVGLILLPIVGNAAEHATAVTVAVKDKMDLAIGVAVGSSMQIALLVLPLMVVLGWIMGKETMDLNFDGFQVAVLFVSVLLVNYLISDGKSHWLEGVLLQCLYLIIAVTAWFYPHQPLTD